MFTKDLIKSVCPMASDTLLNEIMPFLNTYANLYKINNKLRTAHFIGQVAQESGGFTTIEENLNYSTPERIAKVFPKLANRADSLIHDPVALANAAYANKIGNRGEESGDGWKFHGRGLIQLTGYENYLVFGRSVGIDLVSKPELAASPEYAVRLAMMFWEIKGCNAAADLNDYKRVTKSINAALEGLQARTAFTNRAATLL